MTTMKQGACIECGAEGDLAILAWNRGEYAGYCADCARRFLKEQFAGARLKREHPEFYEECAREYDKPIQLVVFRDATGYYDIGYRGEPL